MVGNSARGDISGSQDVGLWLLDSLILVYMSDSDKYLKDSCGQSVLP